MCLLTFQDVLNPICVARLVYDDSIKPLTLRRVPPNLLVGEGAIEYAFNHEIPICPPEYLVSPAAKSRWKKWTRDLEDLQSQPNVDTPEIVKLRNEGQSSSPTPTRSSQKRSHRPKSSSTVDFRLPSTVHRQAHTNNATSPSKRKPSIDYEVQLPKQSRPRSTPQPLYPQHYNDEDDDTFGPLPTIPPRSPLRPSMIRTVSASDNAHLENDDRGTTNVAIDSTTYAPPTVEDFVDDRIIDTVGAIAIDCFGNIAAGSSSGGIGMKHKGRAGPAALVGVGTHVYPVNLKDKSKSTVAVVTSGTGEHMATTMAASTCANRLYFNKEIGSDGDLVDAMEEQALQSFVEHDFLRM